MKRLSIATAVAAAIGVATVPSAATAGPVEDLVGGVQKTVDDTLKSVNGLLGGNGGGAQPAPAPAPGATHSAPTPQADGGTTEPGIDGTNPHGQGEGLDLTTDLPLAEDIVGTVIVGQTRGEQDGGGDYHGNVTILSVSGLGLDVSLPTTDEGQTETGPLDTVNEDILDGVCTASDICLGVLELRSETTDGGSENGFSTVNANILDGLVAAEAVESKGCIQEEEVTAEDDEVGTADNPCEAPDPGCQKAEGSSRVAGAGALGVLNADVIASESKSVACNDGTESATADSEVADLTALDLNLGDLVETTVVGCQTGNTVDDPFSVVGAIVGAALVDVLSGVCNGDDTDGSQADSPYNVRKALGADVLAFLATILDGAVALDISTSESHAVAPPEPPAECPDPTDTSDPDCPPPPDECPDPSNENDPDCPDDRDRDDCPDPSNENDPDCPDIAISPGGPSADDPDDNLPFTGADMGTLGAIGLGVMAIGLALMALTDRRRRAVT